MTFFWVQTTIPTHDGEYMRMVVDAPFATLDEFSARLADTKLVLCDKVRSVRDGMGRRVITQRERIALGVGYVGILQDCTSIPYEQRG